jgi:hypothetical protein
MNFSICHVHPNNYSGTVVFYGLCIPRVIKVTFIRNNLIADFQCDDAAVLPHELDGVNVNYYPDIIMPEIWWRENFS